jgi:hypothetical protein
MVFFNRGDAVSFHHGAAADDAGRGSAGDAEFSAERAIGGADYLHQRAAGDELHV